MLLRSHFTFPFAVGTMIASNMIKNRAASKHFAVAQQRDAHRAAVQPIQQFVFIESSPFLIICFR